MAEQEDSTPSSSPVTQFMGLWNKLGVRQKAIAVASLLVLVIGLSWVTTKETPMDGAILFSRLSPEDAGRLVEELQAKNVPYELTAGGTAIEVPRDRVDELRITLAADGAAPTGGAGVGFELFDRQSFGATNFVEQTNFRRAVEGELGRTISSLATVERARVHIAMGKRSLYARQDDPPTASVVVTLRAGAQLTTHQKRGIANMVASSVDGLAPENVALVDGNGNALSNPGGDMEGTEAAMELERTLARRVEEMLEPVVGPDNLKVTVTADVDRAQIERTERTYDQAPDKIALKSHERHVGGGNGAANVGGEAGARANLPGTAGGGPAGDGAGGNNIHEIKNFEVNQVIERTVGPRQRVRRLHLAILLNEPVDAEGNAVPRTPEQLKSLEALARKAAGLDEQRGDGIEIVSVPFVQPAVEEAAEAPAEAPAPAMPPVWMLAAAAAGVLMFVGFIAFMVVRRRRKKAAAAAAEEELDAATLPKTVEELESELPEDATEDERALVRKPRLEDLEEDATYLERACAMATEDPEIAARVLRGWLASNKKTVPSPGAANTDQYRDAA